MLFGITIGGGAKIRSILSKGLTLLRYKGKSFQDCYRALGMNAGLVTIGVVRVTVFGLIAGGLSRLTVGMLSPFSNAGGGLVFLISALSLLSIQGCSSVVMSGGPGASEAISTEREALRTAAKDVTAVNWPKPTSRSFDLGFTGIISSSKEKVTKRDAVRAYAAQLAAMGDAKARLVEDAQTHLMAADILIRACERTALFAKPQMSDIAVVEGAIGALREAKEVYIAALKVVVEDEDTERFVTRGLKSDFIRAIRDVGEAADLLADKVADNRRKDMADRDRIDQRLTGYFNGSL